MRHLLSTKRLILSAVVLAGVLAATDDAQAFGRRKQASSSNCVPCPPVVYNPCCDTTSPHVVYPHPQPQPMPGPGPIVKPPVVNPPVVNPPVVKPPVVNPPVVNPPVVNPNDISITEKTVIENGRTVIIRTTINKKTGAVIKTERIPK